MTQHIVIVGSGVVGSATGKGFAKVGHDVLFVDIDTRRIDQLRDDGFRAIDHVELPTQASTIFLTLPTPHEGRKWDLTAMAAGTRAVGEALRHSSVFHTVVVRSTVPPGTCEHFVGPLLEESSGMRVGDGFALGSNPEFLRAACALEDFLNPWMTVVASKSKRTAERLCDLFSPFGGEIRCFDDPRTAEMIKCAHNLFNAAKISFWNELWQVSERLGIPSEAVASTVARSAEGSINPDYGIHGGQPYGGACLPKDTKGFLGFASALGMELPLLDAVDRVNEGMVQLATALTDGPTAEVAVDGDVIDLRERMPALAGANGAARTNGDGHSSA